MLSVFAISISMMLFTRWLALQVLAKSDGPVQMRSVASAIREGAEGFLAVQYGAIFRYAFVMAIVIFCLYLTKPTDLAGVSTKQMAILTTGTFCCGAFFSGVAGYVGMWMSVRANVRTAAAALTSYQDAIDVALRAGVRRRLPIRFRRRFRPLSLFFTRGPANACTPPRHTRC